IKSKQDGTAKNTATVSSISQKQKGMARTARNYIISHRGMMGCKLLEQELCIKQIAALQNRLNNNGMVLKLAHIRIKQGNLACRVLVKARELKVSFGFDKNWWCIYGGKYPIRNLFQEEKG
ncbi:10842_t:CDS:2, partial [Gigaspora rosea]